MKPLHGPGLEPDLALLTSTPSFWCLRRDKTEATGEEQRRSGIRKFAIELRLPLPRTLMPHKLFSGDSFVESVPSMIDTESWSGVPSAMSLPVRGPIGALDSDAAAPEESMLAAGHMLSRGSKTHGPGAQIASLEHATVSAAAGSMNGESILASALPGDAAGMSS